MSDSTKANLALVNGDSDDEPQFDGRSIPDGRWGVNLYMQFDAATPKDAVEMFLNQILTFGLRKFCYTVRDRHNEDQGLIFVDNGVPFDEDEYAAVLAAALEADGDDG